MSSSQNADGEKNQLERVQYLAGLNCSIQELLKLVDNAQELDSVLSHNSVDMSADNLRVAVVCLLQELNEPLLDVVSACNFPDDMFAAVLEALVQIIADPTAMLSAEMADLAGCTLEKCLDRDEADVCIDDDVIQHLEYIDANTTMQNTDILLKMKLRAALIEADVELHIFAD